MKKILSGLLILFGIMVFCGYAEAKDKTVKFVQATDVHYIAGDEDAQEFMKQFAKSVNSIKGLNFVVFTGDNIDGADKESLKEFLKLTKKINAPCYFVLGDHDVSRSSGLNKEEYYAVVRINDIFNPVWSPNYKFSKKGFLFVAVDGAKEIIPGPNGYYKQNTLDWLDKILVKNKDKKVVILQHFPLLAPKHVKSHTTYKAENYLNLLDGHDNVIAVISGHYHTNKEEMRNGVYHISTPDMTSAPHYYKLIEIIQTKDMLPMVFTQLRTAE